MRRFAGVSDKVVCDPQGSLFILLETRHPLDLSVLIFILRQVQRISARTNVPNRDFEQTFRPDVTHCAICGQAY
jgi:hypothetical protein